MKIAVDPERGATALVFEAKEEVEKTINSLQNLLRLKSDPGKPLVYLITPDGAGQTATLVNLVLNKLAAEQVEADQNSGIPDLGAVKGLAE